MRRGTAVLGQLDLLDALAAVGEPAWRIERYGPPLAVHDRRCKLDPRHHRQTKCSWPALPVKAHRYGLVRLPHDMQCTSHRAGDLVPAWVCCLCDGVELTEFAWLINHGCCREGLKGMCQVVKPRDRYALVEVPGGR